MTRPHIPVVGVLALQGGVAEHARVLESLGARVSLLRRAAQVSGPDGPRVDALVLPGGESGVIDRLSRRLGLADPLRETIRAGVPTLGTCAGLILLADRIEDPAPGQHSLGVLDVAVRRNAFGAQIASHEAEFRLDLDASRSGDASAPGLRGALIRAPEIVAVGPEARPLARSGNAIVGARARQLPITGVAFHPEVSGDPTLHQMLLGQIEARGSVTGRSASRSRRTAVA